MLLEIIISIYDLIVNDHTILLYRNDVRIHETAIRLETECCIAFLYLLMKFRIDIHCILLNQSLTSLEITLRLDSLNLSKKFTKEFTK